MLEELEKSGGNEVWTPMNSETQLVDVSQAGGVELARSVPQMRSATRMALAGVLAAGSLSVPHVARVLVDGLTAASRLQLCCSSPPFSYSPWMFGSCMISGATAWQTLPPSGYQCIHTCLIATDCFVIPAVAIIWGNLWLVRMTSTRDLLFNTAVVSWTVRINRQIAALVSREKKQKRARLKRNWYHYMLLGRKDRGPSPVHSS